jgi:hypothetical protein
MLQMQSGCAKELHRVDINLLKAEIHIFMYWGVHDLLDGFWIG